MSTASIELEALARALEEARKGPGRFEAVLYQLASPAVATLLGGLGLRSEWARHFVASKAIDACSRTPPISGVALKAEYGRRVGGYKRRKKRSFVLATHTNLKVDRRREFRFSTKSGRRGYHTLVLSPGLTLPRRFETSRRALSSQRQWGEEKFEIPNGVHSTVRVHTKAPEAGEARELAQQAMHLFRGLMSLAWPPAWVLMPTRTRPVSPFWFGPVETLHQAKSGAAASKALSWQHEGPLPGRLDPPKLAWDRLDKYRRHLLRGHPYRADCESALARYGEALGTEQSQSAAVDLWSVLETMTLTTKHPEVVKRVAFLFNDYEEAGALLEHLRTRRNEFVHRGVRIPWATAYGVARELERYTRELIAFHLSSGRRMGSLSRACRALALSPDIDLLKWAVRFRRS